MKNASEVPENDLNILCWLIGFKKMLSMSGHSLILLDQSG
jgi:hypothetical protein